MRLSLLFFIAFAGSIFAQGEGQSFCDGDTSKEYFTLQEFPKYIIWYNTLYTETKIHNTVIAGKEYNTYVQEWVSGRKDTLYIRETKTATVQYYIEKEKELTRYDSTMPVGKSWNGMDVKYTVLSKNKELKTPVCHYKNLMELKAEYQSDTYIFYYLRGFGYVGASKDGDLISFAIPKMP